MRLSRRINGRCLQRFLRGEASLGDLLGVGRVEIDDLAWQADRSLRAGRVAEARRIFELIDLLGPAGNVAGRRGLGVCAQLEGRLDEAERAYDEVIARVPGDVYALANRAEVRLLNRSAEAARTDLAAARAVLDRDGGPADLRRRVERLRELAEGLAAATS